MGFAIQPCESAIGVHISPPFEPPYHLPPHPTPEGCRRAPDLSSLRHTANFHWLSNFKYVNVYVSMLLSQFVPLSPSPTRLLFSREKNARKLMMRWALSHFKVLQLAYGSVPVHDKI